LNNFDVLLGGTGNSKLNRGSLGCARQLFYVIFLLTFVANSVIFNLVFEPIKLNRG
jgi:hypothetical protein